LAIAATAVVAGIVITAAAALLRRLPAAQRGYRGNKQPVFHEIHKNQSEASRQKEFKATYNTPSGYIARLNSMIT